MKIKHPYLKAGYALTLISASLISAALTLGFLNGAARSAKKRIAEQYVVPDYLRYISQGYAFDAVSQKSNILFTVTDGELPIRIHIFTVDTDKNTLDILDVPPDSFIIADGFSGTLREAFETDVYKELVSRAFCLKIESSVSFDAHTAGGISSLLGVRMDGEAVSYEAGEEITLRGESYSSADTDSVEKYHKLLALTVSEISERGTIASFSCLMNLIANRIDGCGPIEKTVEFLNSLSEIKPSKMNIRIARGAPAKFGDGVIWCLDREEVAEQLNKYFRVKDVEFKAEELSIPKVKTNKFPFEDLTEEIDEITG